MKTEFFLNMCFVQDKVNQEEFVGSIKEQMNILFSDRGQWHVEVKQEGQMGIIVAEVNGIHSWSNEEMVFDDLDKEASPQFWEWLQGYQIRFDAKEHAECSHCGKE